MMVESCSQCDVGVNIAYSVKVIQSDIRMNSVHSVVWG